MKKCVLNLATTNGWYIEGQNRLVNSLRATGFDGDIKTFIGERGLRCPSHKDIPYAFKPYAFKLALDRGYDLALWLDCSVWAVKPIQPVFDEIAAKGYHFESCGFAIGQFTSDACLNKMRVSREDAMTMPMLSAGISGLNLKTDIAKAFVKLWYDAANDGVSFRGAYHNNNNEVSTDPRCKGHRHDQSVASIIACQLGMRIDPSTYFQYYTEEPLNEKTVALLRGM